MIDELIIKINNYDIANTFNAWDGPLGTDTTFYIC
jgi:hypothetical protein